MRPAAISASAPRRDAMPARARYLCNLTGGFIRPPARRARRRRRFTRRKARQGRSGGPRLWSGGLRSMRDRALMVAAALVVCGAGTTVPAGATMRLPLAAQPTPRIGDTILQPPRTRQAAFSDPVVAGPPVSRPKTASCKVTLIQNYQFENFTPAMGPYAPPAACPGPWSKVVLDWTVSVSGVQFDRLGAIWLGGTEIFHFTTSEPPGPQITWHVAKDVTEYANTFQTASD